MKACIFGFIVSIFTGYTQIYASQRAVQTLPAIVSGVVQQAPALTRAMPSLSIPTTATITPSVPMSTNAYQNRYLSTGNFLSRPTTLPTPSAPQLPELINKPSGKKTTTEEEEKTNTNNKEKGFSRNELAGMALGAGILAGIDYTSDEWLNGLIVKQKQKAAQPVTKNKQIIYTYLPSDKLLKPRILAYDENNHHTKVGYVIFEPAKDDKDAHITYLYVEPAYRNMGIGTELLKRAAKELAKNNPTQKITGQIGAIGENPQSQRKRARFYQKRGAKFSTSNPFFIIPPAGATMEIDLQTALEKANEKTQADTRSSQATNEDILTSSFMPL